MALISYRNFSNFEIQKIKKLFQLTAGIIFLLAMFVTNSHSAEKKHVYEDDNIRMRLIPRTPDQMSGFYEARGFPKSMVNVLAGYCFMTVGIKNKTRDIFWLDINNWEFTSKGAEIIRVHRNKWPPQWKEMGVPMASQSTFRWTLLPEKLEFFPDEREGGNVIFVSTRDVFSLKAKFSVGKNKSKGNIVAKIKNLQCAQDSPGN